MKLNEGLLVVGEDGKETDQGVFEGSALERVYFPSTLIRIESNAFRNCKNMKKVLLPGELQYIGSACFQYSGLEEVTFPGQLREIYANVFEGCSNLKKVYVEKGCAINVRQLARGAVKVQLK